LDISQKRTDTPISTAPDKILILPYDHMPTLRTRIFNVFPSTIQSFYSDVSGKLSGVYVVNLLNLFWNSTVPETSYVLHG